ncbi:MAG: tetratricopeptide repeat protein [Planctomycetes bacterium]|nr:tetratricopeptide repeat protein [Planctomycetota bacterium]
MPTAEETVDLKETFATEDLPIGRIIELRRLVHTSIERRGELERVSEAFPEIAKRLSSENKAETRRATLLWTLGRVEDAVPVLEKARASKEKSYLLGVSYLDIGRPQDALAQLKEAYEADPADGFLGVALAEAYVKTGLVEEAQKLLDRIAKKEPENADVHYVRGIMADLQGFRDQAIEAYEAAMEREPGHPRSLFRLAYMYDLLGDDHRALELYEQLRKIRPLHVNTMINLGVIYEDRGEFEKAADCFRSVLDYFPNHARARLYFEDAQSSMSMYYDEDAARRQAKLLQLLTQPIGEVQFSQRVRNGLTNLGVNTIGDLVAKTEDDLLEVPNFGKTSLREVRDFLASKGLSLATSKEAAARMAAGAAGGPVPVGGVPPADVESKTLADFEWSGRIRKVLESLDLKTVGDLLKKSETELMEHRNLGITSIKEIRRKLGTLGVAMRAE